MNEDLHRYDEFGYCLFRSIISPENLVRLEQDVLDVIQDFKKNPVYPKIKSTEYRDYAPALHLKKQSVADLLKSKIFVDIGKSILGESFDLRFTTTMTKTAERAESFDWHQDSAYSKDPEHKNYTCWIAVTDSKRENGCLRIVPGSHSRGLVKHIPSKLHPPDQEIEMIDEKMSIDVEMNSGDMIVMDPYLFHSSWPNFSGKLRIGLLAGFMKPKEDYLPFELEASLQYLRMSQPKWKKVENNSGSDSSR